MKNNARITQASFSMPWGILNGWGLSKGAAALVAGVLLAGPVLDTTPANAAEANTQQQHDPRRDRLGSNVIKQTNPQDDKGGINDEKQIDDSYQPKGIELGKFLLLPQLENEIGYNTNIYAQKSGVKSDFIERIAPEFQLRSRFANHALNVSGKFEQFLYRRYHSDNHRDMRVDADGRYDFTKTWQATGFFNAYQNYEDRGSPDDSGGKHPTLSYGYAGRTGSKVQAGQFTFSGDIGASRKLFDNSEGAGGAVIRNSDRNRWETVANGRGAYEIFPGYSAVMAVQGNRRQYDDMFDRNGYNRSSNGWKTEAGIGLDISQLIRGDFLVGYMSQNYEDHRFRDPSGLSISSTFNWTPSRLTVVVVGLERTVQETTIAGASGMIHTGTSILVRHEAARNVVLTGTASVFQDAFKGVNREYWTYDSRIRAVWALVPEFYVGGETGYRKRTANVSSAEFNQGVFMLRFGVRM